MNSAPKNAPRTDPSPPLKLAPPMMQAVITRSSTPVPTVKEAEPKRAVSIKPATPARYGRQAVIENLDEVDIDARKSRSIFISTDVIALPEETRITKEQIPTDDQEEENKNRILNTNYVSLANHFEGVR